MIPTSTGLIVIVLGIWCQFGSYKRTFVSALVLTIFEAADAADLPALGGASITPAKLFLAFLVLRIVSMRSGLAGILAEIGPRRVLFLYLLLMLWVTASALYFPRLFQGATDVFSLDRSTIDVGSVPLKPSSGNITQTVYAMGSFVLALCIATLARRPGAYATVLTGLLVLTGLDIGFAVLDIVTAATHTGFLLDLVHTGNYAFLTSDESGGLKRISGSFSEASSFASFSLTLLAVNLSLYVSRVRSLLTGTYCFLLVAFLLLSTSSTAYVGLAIFAAAFLGCAVVALALRGDARAFKLLALIVAAGVFTICVVVLLAPGFAASAWNVIDVSIFQKSQSDSALERGALNAQAMQIFYDTYGLGAGIGATRTSNYILLLLSNLGVVGLVLFAVLVLALLLVRGRPDLDSQDRKIVAAARAGMLGALVPALLIGTIFDLGPLFYMMVGIIASGAGAARPLPQAARLAVRPVRRSREGGWEVGQRPARSR